MELIINQEPSICLVFTNHLYFKNKENEVLKRHVYPRLFRSSPQRLNLRPHEARRKNKNIHSESVKKRAVKFHPSVPSSIQPFIQ